jgi:urease accessory protein
MEPHLKTMSPRLALALALTLFSPLVLAHPGHGGAIADGILHPLTGLDHLVAMLGIGIWSAQQSGRARWLIPASFVCLMGASAWTAVLGTVPGYSPAFIESGIAASVLLIGLLISFSTRASALAGASIAAVFAVFHGFAHGAELPGSVNGWLYGGGFLATTILLQVAGLVVGNRLKTHHALVRFGGAGITVWGGLLALQGLH